MEFGNNTKPATFQRFLHLTYKKAQLFFFCDSAF